MTITMIMQIIEALKKIRVPHDSYLKAVKRMVNAIVAAAVGEMIVFVGPSRVGKSRCVFEACGIVFPASDLNSSVAGAGVADNSSPPEIMPFVFVEAENASKNGEFSTKAFMIECLKAVKHPLYGMADADDPWEIKLIALHERTPERKLREAFEKALKLRKVKVLVIDEAQHVEYVAGDYLASAKVLNSWKCIANKCGVKIILSGSYRLLNVVSLAPHVIGRQRPIEFPRYRSDVLEDVVSWEKILVTLSKLFPSGEKVNILGKWNKLLIQESSGCIGHLIRCLRSTLGEMIAHSEDAITKSAIQRSCLPTPHLLAVLEEIEDGERFLKKEYGKSEETAGSEKAKPTTKPKKTKTGRPFQRNARRSPHKGRS
jgi:hypothetical protein